MEGQVLKGVIDTQRQCSKNLGNIQLNDTVILELQIVENEESLNLSGSSITLLAKKYDNKMISQVSNISIINAEEGKIKIELDKQCITCVGVVACQICITDSEKYLSTGKFFFIVNSTLEGEVIESIRKFETLDDLDKWLLESNKELEKFKNYMKVLADNNINFEGLIEVKDFVGTNLNNLKEQNSLSKINIEDLINKSAIATNKIIELDKRNENLDAIKEINSIAEKNIKNLESSNDLSKNNLSNLEEKNNIANKNILDLDDRNKKSIENIETLNKKNNDAITTISNLDSKNEIANKNITDLEAKNKIANETKDSLLKENDEAKKMIDSVNNDILGFKSLEKEVMDSRKDFNNTIHENLEDRLQEDLSVLFNKINNASLLSYEDSNITARYSFEGYTKDLSIKGQTLQNLITNPINTNVGLSSGTESKYKISIKPNTIYTLIYTLKNIPKKLIGKEMQISYTNGQTTCSTCIIKEGINISKSITPSKGLGDLWIYYLGYAENELFQLEQPILLEGDYTDKTIPSFFEGIKSVAENKKIEIKTTGKNLFNINSKWNTDITNLVGKVEIKNNSFKGVNGRCWFAIDLKGATKISLSFDAKCQNIKEYCNLEFYGTNTNETSLYKDWSVLKTQNITENLTHYNLVFDVSKYKKLIFFMSSCNSNYFYIENLQIEEGDKATDYEPYKEETKIITLDEPLKGLFDIGKNIKVQDEISTDGKLIKRIKKCIITDKTQGIGELVKPQWDDIYALFLVNVSTAFNEPAYPNLTFPYAFGCCISDKFNYYDNFITKSPSRQEGICCINAMPNYIGICIKKEKLKTPDYSGFVNWLKENPITVYYSVENPVITDLKDVVNLNLRTYEGTTYINSNNSLQPIIECKVPSNMPKIVQDLKHKNIELKSKLVNLNKEQINKAMYELENDLRLSNLEMSLTNNI